MQNRKITVHFSIIGLQKKQGGKALNKSRFQSKTRHATFKFVAIIFYASFYFYFLFGGVV